MTTDLTPMMRQYLVLKADHKDTILFFRLGDFYEMFFDDAKEASHILHITLTSREAGKGNKVPMCGIPYHAASNYIARLIKQGKKVAICEQMEEPSPGKKIVKREITKIVTPGTFIQDDLLDGPINNYILSLNEKEGRFGLAYADISTGEFRVTELNGKEEFYSELYKISPKECLISEDFSRKEIFQKIRSLNLGALTVRENWLFDYELSLLEIKRHFMVDTLEGFGCAPLRLAITSAGALLKYLKDTQKNSLTNVNVISTYSPSQFLAMDASTHRHLELVESQEDLSSRNTLLEVLDETKTAMGKRELKKWLLSPLLDIDAIRTRQEMVAFFYENTTLRRDVRDSLESVYDIERLSNKINMGTANARDITGLKLSLEVLGQLKQLFPDDIPQGIEKIISGLNDFRDVIEEIGKCLIKEPPLLLKDGGLIKKGYDSVLDELRGIVSGGKDWLVSLQKREIERTGINSLKVGYNSIFGYYIEVTNSNLSQVPSDYIRKQTLVSAERFITEELKKEESLLIGSSERSKKMEYEIFCALRERLSKKIDRLKILANNIAKLDVVSALAEAAVKNHYVCPKVNSGKLLQIKDGRHPVIEKILKDKEFVPNDVYMNSDEERIFIITGSNMAGKSTFIRQIALITIMAQMGSFVPSKEAEIGVVDRIFTRVGAQDRLYRGMSTFMAEMVETANILNNATERSLIILDEVGRGTSTYDGVSIAWATVEHICHYLGGAKAMFATHYHELTELASMMKGVKNYHLAVREWGEEVAFLYKVVEGSCDESFGIHVARLAGMPKSVVERARQILDNLRKDSFKGSIRRHFAEKDSIREQQIDFFEER